MTDDNSVSKKYLIRFGIVFLLVVLAGSILLYNFISFKSKPVISTQEEIPWEAPPIYELSDTPDAEQILYGRDLIIHTSKYFGPKGSIATITNGMECQNCHLDAGTRPYGNSFGAVAATYPKFRERSGREESIVFRVNECMLRSLNGQIMDSTSRAMSAIVAYLKWLGKDVPKGIKPPGTGITMLAFLKRAADPGMGKNVYVAKCMRCHGTNGEGQLMPDGTGFTYPPLWGSSSYNVSAGIHRISSLAGFIFKNMPYTATPEEPQVTEEEAWDVAAFISSQQRPKKFFSYDWKKIDAKPIDYPFGPYADSLTEIQHKYGPYTFMKLK